MAENVILIAHCLCKAHTFATSVPKNKLPLEASACHCTSCRHNNGGMYSIDATWPEPRANVDTSALKSYAFSERINLLFCGACSTPLFFEQTQDPSSALGVFTGALENTPGNIVKITNHIFVADTIDGGASMWLRHPNVDGTVAKRFVTRGSASNSEEYPLNWPPSSALTGFAAKKEDAIPIRCKCAGTSFVLHRDDYTGKKREDLPWFIDPRTHKSLCGTCACDSCRLSSGIDIFNWTFAEMKNISFPSSITDTKPGLLEFPKTSLQLKALVDEKAPQIGTLTYYASSPDIQRYFCSKCSACVFYAADDRCWMINVAVGVLDASDGARAEGMISWALGSVGQTEDTKGGWREEFVKKVAEDATAWREDRGYPVCWRTKERAESEARGVEYM